MLGYTIFAVPFAAADDDGRCGWRVMDFVAAFLFYWLPTRNRMNERRRNKMHSTTIPATLLRSAAPLLPPTQNCFVQVENRQGKMWKIAVQKKNGCGRRCNETIK